MLATEVATLPVSDSSLLFEVKLDGVRAGLIIDGNIMRILSRKGTNMTTWFPELGQLPRQVRSSSVVIDGEIVAGNGSIASFNDLLRRTRARGKPVASILVTFVAFDVLWIDGTDWTQKPLRERREELQRIILEDDRLAISRVFSDGRALFAAAADAGLEGVVGKRIDSIYEPNRRSRNWLKCKVPGAWKGHDWNSTRRPH